MDSPSTEALLNGDFDAATQSLLDGDVPDLLDKVLTARYQQSPLTHNLPSPITHGQLHQDAVYHHDQHRNGQRFKNNERSRDIDVDLNMDILEPLFVRIRQFLEFNGLSPSFLRVFSGYVRVLLDNELDPLADEYLLCVQNELGRSLVISKGMEDILAFFLVKPTNMYMAIALFEYRRDKLILQCTYKNFVRGVHLRYREKHFKTVSGRYVQSTYLSQWRNTYEKKAHVWNDKANGFDNVRLKIFGYDKWLEKKEINEKRKKLADDYLMDRIFKRFHKKYIILQEQEQNMVLKQQQLILSVAMKKWKLRKRESDFKTSDTNSMKTHLKLLKQKMKKIELAQKMSDKARDEFLLRRGLRNVVVRYDSQKEYESQLELKEEYYAKKKWMELLFRKYKYRKLMEKAVDNEQLNLLRKYFVKTWSLRYEHRLRLYQYQVSSEERFIRGILVKWSKKTNNNKISSSFTKRHIGSSFIQKWRLKTREKRYRNDKDGQLLRNYLDHWVLQSLNKKKARDFSMRNAYRKFMIHWKEKSNLLAVANEKAQTFNENRTVSRNWGKLVASANNLQKMDEKADSYIKLKHFKLLQEKLQINISLQLIHHKVLVDKFSKMKMRYYLTLWKSALENRNQIKLQGIEDEFNEMKKQHLKEKFFKTFLYAMYSKEADKTHARSVQLKYYLKIIEKMDFLRDQEIILTKSINTSLSYKFFSQWQRKRLKIVNLQQLYLDTSSRFTQRSKKDLFLHWHKKVKFDDSMVEKIQVRWSRALLRGCLQAWREKTERNSTRKAKSEIFETPAKNISRSPDGTVSRKLLTKNNTRRAKLIASPIKGSSVLESVLRKRIQQNNNALVNDSKPNVSSLEAGISKLNFIDVPQLPPSDARLKGSPTRRKSP